MTSRTTQASLIAIEGVVGVGKTTLARILAERFGGQTVLEDAEAHPFLGDFYKSPADFTIETELGFVLLHYHQLHKAELDGLFQSTVVADFIFGKDKIFADLNLTGQQLDLFDEIFSYLSSHVPRPSAVIYLRASTAFAMERIRARGRQVEMAIEEDYLDRLNEAYEGFFSRDCDVPVVVIDAEKREFLTRPTDVEAVEAELAQIGVLSKPN